MTTFLQNEQVFVLVLFVLVYTKHASLQPRH